MLRKLTTKLASLLVLFFLLIQTAFAQSRVVTGKVTDANGTGVPGVTVTVRGTKTSTQTDNNGDYSISASGNATLVFSSVGFTTTSVSVGGRSSVNTVIANQTTNLNEVVVVGYGTARKRDLTGASTTVTAKDFNKGTYTSADQLIQGKVSGVQMINNSGQPGGESTVKIRGNSAVTGTGQPLYVIDGVALDGRSARPGLGDIGLGGSNPNSNPLNFLNPSDIASIDVLKDASATAIYGSRAAYGVVLITTKRGQSGQTRVDFGVSTGFSHVAKKLRVLNASEFRQALSNYNLGNANDLGSSVDAFDAITRTGLVQNYNVGISGGNETGRYRISMGALDQQGIVKKSGIKKYTANLNAQFKFLNSKKLGLDVNIIPSQTVEQLAPISNNAGSRGSLIGNALQWNPTAPLTTPRPGKSDSFNVIKGGDLINPLALQNAINDKAITTTLLGSVSPYVKFTDFLEYRFLYSVNYSTGSRRTSIDQLINFNDTYGKGRALIAQNELVTQQYTNTLSFNKQIASKLNLNAVAGFEYVKYSNKGYGASGYGANNGLNGFGVYGLDYTNYLQFTQPDTRSIYSFVDPSSELQSYFARALFNFDDKYLITGTFRRDGSSKFGTNNKYGNFPSISAAWVVNKESFFNVPAVNTLKIRAGWGITGNQEFPSGSSVRTYSFSGNGVDLNQNNFENPDLKWQSDKQYNIGFDAGILKNRVTITGDYFNKKTTDLLFPRESAQPAPPGSVIQWFNLPGTIENSGFELAINSSIIQKKDLTWDFGVNATFLKNRVSGLVSSIPTGTLDGQGVSGTQVERIKSGYPINSFFTRHFGGFDKDGFAIYPNQDIFTYEGSPNPTKLLGISTTLRYKALTLTVNMNGAFGHVLYNNTLNNVVNVGSINNGKNIAYSIFKSADKESLVNPVTSSSRFLEKGDYLKLSNATLSYGLGNLGKSIRGVNVFVTGQNLFVLTKYTGFDPEVNTYKGVNGVPSSGIEYIPYPSARTITFGLNFSL